MKSLELGDTRLIMGEARRQGLLRNQLAYVLASAFWETGKTMKPVKEAYWLSEDWRRKNLRYFPWYGRGYVQITWEENYKKAARLLGIPFDKNADLALDPRHAVKILVTGMKDGWFTGKKLSDYVTLYKSDFVNARRIVNGVDKKNEIAEIAKAYDALLRADGYGEVSQESHVKDSPDYSEPEGPNSSIWEVLLKLARILWQTRGQK